MAICGWDLVRAIHWTVQGRAPSSPRISSDTSSSTPSAAGLDAVAYAFDCPSSDAAWSLLAYRCDREINQCYRAELVLLRVDEGEEPGFGAGIGVGQRASLHMYLPDQVQSIGGIITRVESQGLHRGHACLRIWLEPALALLGRGRGSRSFFEQSVQAMTQTLIRPLCAEYGFSLQMDQLRRGEASREYSVQYDESELQFLTRIWSLAGINYAFGYDRDAESETLVLFDDHRRLPSCLHSQGERIFDIEQGGGLVTGAGTVSRFELQETLVHASRSGQHWDWALPGSDNYHAQSESRIFGVSSMDPSQRCEDFDQLHQRVQDARSFAQSRQRVGNGESLSLGVCAAHRIEIAGHPQESSDGEYIVTKVSERGFCPEHAVGTLPGIERYQGWPRYHNAFACVELARTIRPDPAKQRRGLVGAQTAMVCGPEIGQPHVDAQGRVQLCFHWDLERDPQDPATCWVRVAQGWAGAGFGSSFFPRAGSEVVVEFLGGDPEQPVVTGAVHNGSHPPGFDGAVNPYQSGIRSRSGQGSYGYNLLCFDDTRGRERLLMRAEQRMSTIVQGNRDAEVGGSSTCVVQGDEQREVHGDLRSYVGQSHALLVEGPASWTLAHSLHQEVGSEGLTIQVEGAVRVQSQEEIEHEAQAGFALRSSEGGASLELAEGLVLKAQSLSIHCGKTTLEIDASGAVSLDAGDAPVSLQGSKIRLNCG